MIAKLDTRQAGGGRSAGRRRLLSSFQSNLEEITIIALPEGMHNGESCNAVQIHSYQDSSKREPGTCPSRPDIHCPHPGLLYACSPLTWAV